AMPVSMPAAVKQTAEAEDQDDVNVNVQDDLEKQKASHQARINGNAEAELENYIKFVPVVTRQDVKAVLDALNPVLNGMVNMGQSEVCLYWFDNCQLAEPSEAYALSHNIFSRASPFKKAEFASFVKTYQSMTSQAPPAHALVCFDEGSPAASGCISAALNKLKDHHRMELDLLPTQAHLEKRAAFKSGA
ncbi:unnamed protein product, partial [Symbiodinium sp. CCMP2456]